MRSKWDDNEFNPPGEMLTRAMFLICVAGFTVGIIVSLGGVAAGELRWLGLGGVLLVGAGLSRAWLRRRGRFNCAGDRLLLTPRLPAETDAALVAELIRLLRQWDELEGRRGSSRFDPWELQSIRHEIRGIVERDPRLEELFHDRPRAA